MQLREREYWTRASSLIDDHGDDALQHALLRIAELLESGDIAEAARWTKIVMVIRELEMSDAAGPIH
jgi:hypothetical protein